MSLLIPNASDQHDAVDGYQLLPSYKDKLSKLKNKKDATSGEVKFPWDFEVVPNFFKQSSTETNDLEFRYTQQDFGITKPWPQLVEEINKLNENAAENECYKLLFLARHGQGYHNVIVSKYGQEQWAKKWHALERDGDIVYAPDPELTELGKNQARENHEAWKVQLSKGAPIPSKFYVSPLQRSCNTLRITWDGLRPKDRKPLIVESVREVIGFHLCNKRSTRSIIDERFGKHGFKIESGFVEEDIYHKNDEEERFDDHCLRINSFMQRMFDENYDKEKSNVHSMEDQFVAITSHGGTMKCFFAIIGHRQFVVSTGGMIPVVVKGTRRI